MDELNLTTADCVKVVEKSGAGSIMGAVITAGAMGAVGTHLYYKKRYKKERIAELALIWMIKNVSFKVGDGEIGLRVGPAKINIATDRIKQSHQARTPHRRTDIPNRETHSEEMIDDEDIDF